MSENLNIEIITSYALIFRKALEKHIYNHNQNNPQNIISFPHEYCHEGSLLLGFYLKKNGIEDVKLYSGQVIHENQWRGIHQWIEINNIKVDITSDQFDGLSADQIIVSANSQFHNNYIEQRSLLYDNFDFNDQPSSITKFYYNVESVINNKQMRLT